MTDKKTVARVAAEFARGLKRLLTCAEFRELVERNAAETRPNICHSHDYCDANVVMAAAFKRVTGRKFEVNCDNEADELLFNAAWAKARESGFSVKEGKK